MIFVIFSVLGLYIASLLLLLWGTKKSSSFTLKRIKPGTKFSVLIPFRNEENNLSSLLNSLNNLEYPTELFEVILINDASEDDSEELVRKYQFNREFQVRLVQNIRKTPAPKKDALATGITFARFDWVVTSDADCLLPPLWLQTFHEFILTENPDMICAPVIYKTRKNFLHQFQLAENLMLQFVTKGAFGLRNPVMCNGANLAYRKTVFNEVGGFKGNEEIASGDDIFLMEKFRKSGKNICFLNSSDGIVKTKPQESFNELISQRVRWASKTSKQKNSTAFILGSIVAAANLIYIFSLCTLLFLQRPYFLLIFITFKILIEMAIIRHTSKFYQKMISYPVLLLSIVFYPFIFVITLFKSMSQKYVWKGRKFDG